MKDEYEGDYKQYLNAVYCDRNLRLPIKKGSCKKQKIKGKK